MIIIKKFHGKISFHNEPEKTGFHNDSIYVVKGDTEKVLNCVMSVI